MRRRTFLTSLAVLAGYTSESRSNQLLTPDTDSPTVDTNPIPAEDLIRRTSIRYYRNNDAIGADRPERDQYLYIHVREGGNAEPEDYTLRFGDQILDPVAPRGFKLSVPGIGDYYENGRGWLVFDVPAVDPGTGALVSGDQERSLASAALGEFAETSSTTVQNLSVPERVTPGEDIVVIATIHNDGERIGQFLGGVQRGGQARPVTTQIPVGESINASGKVPTHDGEREVRVVAVLPGDDRSFTVPIESTATASEG